MMCPGLRLTPVLTVGDVSDPDPPEPTPAPGSPGAGEPTADGVVVRSWWFLDYPTGLLRPDIVAGVSTAAVIIPQALGYATIAGLPVEFGLYTCIFPMLVYALLGTSRRLSFSTTSTVVAVAGVALAGLGLTDMEDLTGAAATLALLVGILLLAFRLLQLGWLVEAVSGATVTGLKLGVGLTVIADQLLRVVGAESDGGFFSDVRTVAGNLDEVAPTSYLVLAATIVGVVGLARLDRRIPGALLAIAAAIMLVRWSGLDTPLVSAPPTGLPLPVLPTLAHATALLPAALAIAVMSYVETMTAGRVARLPEDPPLDNNREFVATGLASAVGAFFHALPPAGGFSQTQVNTAAGARTQMSQIATVGVAVVIAVFLAPLLGDIPVAALAGVVIVAVAGLIDLPAFARLWRIDRPEFVIAAASAIAALAFDLVAGVAVGVVLTFFFVIRALNHPVVVELRRDPRTGALVAARASDPRLAGLLVLRIEGGVYTMNVHRVQEQIYARAYGDPDHPTVVILDVSGTADTSVTVLDVLRETDQELDRRGIDLWVAGFPVRSLDKVERTTWHRNWVARGKVHPTVADATDRFERSR